MVERAYVALGANLGEPRRMFEDATMCLIKHEIRVLRRARLYLSPPLGPADQPDFLNSMLELETNLTPHTLLATLQAIERALGREKTRTWGPRTIDLDIILFGDRRIETPELTIPHRHMNARRFVLAPLADLCPDHTVPGFGTTVRALLAARGEQDEGLRVLEDRVETYAPPLDLQS